MDILQMSDQAMNVQASFKFRDPNAAGLMTTLFNLLDHAARPDLIVGPHVPAI